MINWFEEICLVMYILGVPFTFWCLNRSVHWTLFAANIIGTLGAWIKFVAFDSYPVALFGQAIMSSINCLMLTTPPVLASVWFKPDEHFLAVSFAAIANFIGGGFGFLLSASVVYSTD
jgi:hypothetical protein